MATEAETKEPMSEIDDVNDAANAIENSVGGKQENECHQSKNGTNSEKESEAKVETETEAVDEHAMNISEKTTADETTFENITDLTEAQTEEKENKFHDETANIKPEEEIVAKNGNLKDENVNYSISDAKQSEKGSTNEPTEINTSNIPKTETIEKEEENLEEVIEGKEVETQGDDKMHEVESIWIAEPTEVKQKLDTNVLARQETEDDNQNDDEETGRGDYGSDINVGVSQSPLNLQETHDHEDVSRTKNEREINETINYQGTTEENVQIEKTDADNRELDVEAVEIDEEYHKEMSEDKEVLIQDQLASGIGETEIAEVNNAECRSTETSRINLDGDAEENDCQLKAEDKSESFDVYEIAKEEEERMPTEDTKESSSTTMKETGVKEDEENIDESKDTNSLYDDQTNARIGLSNVLSQDEQRDEKDEFTSLKIENEIQTEPTLYETDDTTETSGANIFKGKESMERDTENSIQNQLQQNSSDVYLDSLTTELETETIGEIPINKAVKEDTSKASTEAPSIFTVEVSQDQVEGVNAIDTKVSEEEEIVAKNENLKDENVNYSISDANQSEKGSTNEPTEINTLNIPKTEMIEKEEENLEEVFEGKEVETQAGDDKMQDVESVSIAEPTEVKQKLDSNVLARQETEDDNQNDDEETGRGGYGSDINDEENIDESKDTNSLYGDQTNASIGLSNVLSQDEQRDVQDEFTSLKIENEIQTEPTLYETDDTTETGGANIFKGEDCMEGDTENSIQNQLQQNSSDVYLDSLTTELETETEGEIPINEAVKEDSSKASTESPSIFAVEVSQDQVEGLNAINTKVSEEKVEIETEGEIPIKETVKEDTSKASTEAPSIFAVEVSQDQVEGVNAIDTKDDENIDESKDNPTLTKTTQIKYDDQTDASISLINGLSQDEQKDKQDEFTSLKIGHEMQTEPKLYETDDTVETSSANSFKDEENMERNIVNNVEKQLQQNSSDVYLDSLNAELEIETEEEIPINETVKEDISNASTGAPSIFAVEVSQYLREESNAIDTNVSEEKARDIGLATLDGTLSPNKAMQEMNIRDDREYKEEKLEAKVLQEEQEDKSIKKETGTGEEQEFYEARDTMETKQTDFKESVAAERNVDKETLDGPRFLENVTEPEDTHVNEMEKETLKAKKDKESNDEDLKNTMSNSTENSNLQESPALITDEMEGADIQIADDLIQKPEKEEADNVMAQKDRDESMIVEKEITSTSNDTSVKARTVSENECGEKNEIIASSENNKLEEEQLAMQHITEAKQESFYTNNANDMEEDEGFQDKESTEENISEKEILEYTEHEKSPHVILEDLETTTETKDIQDIESENQGIQNEDNGKKIEASASSNAEAIPSNSTLEEDTEPLANQLPEKAINITTGENILLVSQLPNEAADSNASLKIDSDSKKNRYIDANVEEEKFEDAAKEKENDKPELGQPHVENEVSGPDEIIIVKEKENCSTKILSQSKDEITVEPIVESEPKIKSCCPIRVTKGGHPGEEEYKNEAVAVEDDRSQEDKNEKREEIDDMNEELKGYKMEPKVGTKTMEEGEEDRSIEEINIMEDITTEVLDVYPKLHEEQKEEQHTENKMLAEKTTYKSCDLSGSSENKSNKEKETADDILTFERTEKTDNIPEATSITENVIREEEDFHTRLQEEEQNESLDMENEKLVENTTYESCDASGSNKTGTTKEKERAKKDIVNPEESEITTEVRNIHESEIMDIDAYSEHNPQSSEEVISETEIDPDDQNTNSIQTTESKLSEKARESELGPQINTETPCDTMDVTYVSLDKEMQNDFEAVEDKIHSKVDVIHVSEDDEEKKEAHSSLQNKEVEGETHTEQQLYEESKFNETNENEIFENKENTEKTDSGEDKSEGKELDISSCVPFVNSDVLAEIKDRNHIEPEKQEPVTIHEASFNKEEEYVVDEEANFQIQHVNRHEDTMEEEDITPEHLSHQTAEKEATITTNQETGAERKSSNEKEIEEKDISEYKIADTNDNVNQIETEKQYAQIDDEHNLQKGEDIMLIKSTTETEPANESTDSTHTIDRETHTEKVNNVVIASPEKNIQYAHEVIEDAVQTSCVELEDSYNNDKEKEETNIISQNKGEVIKPPETVNERKLRQDYNGINNEEDTQKGEDMHAELAVCLNPAIQSSNSITENEEGRLTQKDDELFGEEAAIGKVKVEELATTYIDTEILHDNALQKLSLEAEEKVLSADIQVNAENEKKDSKTKENEAEIDLKGLEVATENQTICGSKIKNQDATNNKETVDVELDTENQDNESIHTILEAVTTNEEVKDIDLVPQEDTKPVQVEEKIYCTREENGKALVNVEKKDKVNIDNIASWRKEDFDENPREELNGNPRDREEGNEQLQAEQTCFESFNSRNIYDNASFLEKESVSEEEMKDRKPESFPILVPTNLNAPLKSNIEKETTEFNDEKHVQKEEDTMLVESAITEESGNESNTLVSGTDGATFEEAKKDELASQNDVEMTHANALNGNEDPLHKNIENDNTVLDVKILSETSEGHENKSSLERNLIIEESAKIAAVNQEKDQDEEHIEESEMDQSDGKVEQSESTIKMGIENNEINTALTKDDMIETAHAELLNEGKAELDVGVLPVDRVKGDSDRLKEQSKMLSNDTGKETDDSFSKISNYWPINYNDEALNVEKMETLKLGEITESSDSSLQPAHDEDMLQDRSLQDPELNQSEQVKETEQLISTKASAEVENDNLQEENLPFSQFLMKHILMNDSDSVKTSYDEKIVDISKHDNDKREADISITKEDEALVPSSSVEKIHNASIVDDGADFHEKHQENIEVQVDDKSDVKDNSEVTDNQKETLTTESPISVLEQTQYTSIPVNRAINDPQETNKVQVADECDVKDNSKVINNRQGNFPMELPISAAEQTQHTSIIEDKTINENAQKNIEIQVDDECDVKNNPESTENIKETFTTQSPISVIEKTQYTNIPEHKAINQEPQGTDEVQLADRCYVNDDSKVTDDKKEFSALGLPITVDNSMTEHKFDTCIHDEEFMQNDVDTQQNGKPKDNVVAEKLLNSYDPAQAEKSYGVTSDSETNFVKSEDKDVNISNTLSEKSIPAVKEEEDIHLISADREIKEDNPNLLMDEQIFGKTLDDTITENKSLHKKDCNELKAENLEIIEDEMEERILKNGMEDEITVADLQEDQQSNTVVEPETALGENNLECDQDTHQYENENEKEQKKFEVPTSSEGKVNSEIEPVENVEDNQDELNQKNDSTEEQSLSESQKAQEVDGNNTDDDEDENQEGEHKGDDSIHGQTINVESRDVDVTPTKKKSHGILSGVGSKVKRSIIKVKKAITGKSSHSETQSAK